MSTDEDETPIQRAKRDDKLLVLLDAARDLAAAHDEVTAAIEEQTKLGQAAPTPRRLRANQALAQAEVTLRQIALAWAGPECPICGRRGDHEWAELTRPQRLAHEAP